MSPTWNDYQQWALEKMKPEVRRSQEALMTNGALGLAGEAGEFADMVKKILHQDQPLDTETRRKMILELGDVLFYVATAARSLDVSLQTVVSYNIDKLNRRYPNGFTATGYRNKASENDAADAVAYTLESSMNNLTEPERRKLYEGKWIGAKSESTAPQRESPTAEPPTKGQANVAGPTMREIDEREGLIPTRITTTTTSEAEPSVLGIGNTLYDERFPNGYSMGRRVSRPWFKEGSGPGRRDTVTPETKPTPTSEAGRDLDGSGGTINDAER